MAKHAFSSTIPLCLGSQRFSPKVRSTSNITMEAQIDSAALDVQTCTKVLSLPPRCDTVRRSVLQGRSALLLHDEFRTS